MPGREWVCLKICQVKQDVWVRMLDRFDTMDRKLTQLDSIQVWVNKITDQVYTMKKKINSLEAKMANVEQSRVFDSKSIDLLQEKQNKIDNILKKKCKNLRPIRKKSS